MQEIKLVYKEIKNHPRFSLIYIITMFLGLFGLMVISNFNDSFKSALESRSKSLLTADLAIVSRRPLTNKEKEHLNTIMTSHSEAMTSMIELYHMAQRVDGKRSRLAQIKAIAPNYPLYGKVSIKEGKLKLSDIFAGNFIVVDQDVLHQFQVTVGDSLKIGGKLFTIHGVIDEDLSSSWRGISMAPKIYVAQNSIQGTGLMGFGTVASYYEFFKFSPELIRNKKIVEKVTDELNEKIKDPGVSIMGPEKASEQVARVMNYLSDFLGLVALVALFLSIIGIVYMGQSYFFDRLTQIGILRSLGMEDWRIRIVFQVKLMVLALASWVLAIVITGLVQDPIQRLLIELDMPFEFTGSLSLETTLVTFLLSVVASFLIGLLLTVKVFQIPTREILFGQKYFRWQWKRSDYLLLSPLALIFWPLAIWQSNSLLVGTVFMACLISTSILLLFGFWTFLKFTNKIIGTDLSWPALPLALALRQVVRSPVNSAISMWAIGIGVMLLALISQIETGLQRELLDDSISKPSLFLFDIQPEQERSLQELADNESIPLTDMVPMVRARISQVNGKPYTRDREKKGMFETREENRERNFRNRGVNLTYEKSPNESISIVEGKKMPSIYNPEVQKIPFMAIETRYAKRMGLKMGDEVTFDILGVEVTAKIVQIRRIRWTSFNPNFFIVLQKGVIDEAPQTFLSTVAKVSKDRALDIQDKLVDQFPNISMINVDELVAKILGIFRAMSGSVRIMAFLCILVGLIVIVSINYNQLTKQYYELAIQKILGMNWLAQLLVSNSSLLLTTIFSTILGVIASIGVAKIFSEIFFDGAWSFNLQTNLLIMLFMCLATIVTVTVGSIRVLKSKPKVYI